MNPQLLTERLLLRDARPDDLPLLLALDADPGVKQFIDNGAPVDVDDVRETLGWWLGYRHRTPGYGFWLAFDRDDDRFVGWFHLRPPPDRPVDEPELGYRLHRADWGRGLAAEGSVRLLEHAFTTQDASRVFATTLVVHQASRRVMEKLGMHVVRIFPTDWPIRIPGDEHGDVEYAITRAEWERQRGSVR